MEEVFAPELITLEDEAGGKHYFEELDRVQVNNATYVALVEVAENENDASDDIVLLEVQEENGEVWLQPVTDETLFNQIATLFQERLNDMFGFEDDL